MARRPGRVNVTTEVGYCSFCNRTRNLRREEHVLGALVRTILTCESCHRTLSSSTGVRAEEPPTAEVAAGVESLAPAAPEPAAPEPAAKELRRETAAGREAAAKSAAPKKPAAKKPSGGAKTKTAVERRASKK